LKPNTMVEMTSCGEKERAKAKHEIWFQLHYRDWMSFPPELFQGGSSESSRDYCREKELTLWCLGNGMTAWILGI